MHHLQSVQDKLGFVPMFAQTMESLSDTAGPIVDLMTKLTLGATDIEPKVRALVGIGAATASGHNEFVAFHTGLHPDLHEREINEAQFLGAHTAGLSAFLAARAPSFETFKQDVEKMATALKKLGGQKPVLPQEGNIQDQIRAVYGFVPVFLLEMAKLHGALEPVWNVLRTYHLEKTHLEPQVRAMINLAAAASIRCPHTIYLHTRIAEALGVSETRLQEASLLAYNTVQWGTYLRSRGFGRAMLWADAHHLRERAGAVRV